ncbi:MAG: tungstate ABC transporter substrate-binding protein WtpA [Bacteroidetes bacterium]|nr:tungstate ABC transporter substrate-binding protein WtpA [Bacteroidota bacterium]
MFGQTDNKKLIIFHAGSLARPFAQIIQNFQEENPGVEILKEIAGSRACARKITDLGKECDILASADYEVIDNLLIPEYADWNLKFAANEMTIVYTKQSRLADQINQSNWHEILLKKEINFGRSDPNNDPCGYRTILTWKLSESYYNHPGLAEKLLKKNKEYVRPKEVDLLALLEAGELDYIFLYRSVAEQHKLPFLLLPDSINLKEGKCTELYKSVSVDVTGKKPGEYVTHMGTPMLYGVTIPHNAPNKTLANKFIHFLMNEDKGLKILRENGQPTVVPSLCESYNKLPEEFKPYALK